MSALENAKNMSSEEVIAKIVSSGLKEYGVYNEPVVDRWNQVLDSRKEDAVDQELVLLTALNNADTKGVLLELLKKNSEKVFEGMKIAAYAVGAKQMVLQIPEYAEELADKLQDKADAAGVVLVVGLVNVRAAKYNIVDHVVTMIDICDIFEDSYTAGVYVAVKSGECKKYETGYTFSSELVADKTLQEVRIANGVLNVMTSKNCIIQEVESRVAASRKQSCGKCVFCREGLIQLHGMVSDIKDGKGKVEYPETIKEIGSAMTFSTPCSMGQESAKIALTSVELFGKEYEEHIKKKTCSAGVCFNKSTIYIDPQKCEGCEECSDVCPEECIEGKKNFIHMIDEFDCMQCGKCMEACEYDAIIQTNGKVPKLPDRLTKCGKFKKH